MSDSLSVDTNIKEEKKFDFKAFKAKFFMLLQKLITVFVLTFCFLFFPVYLFYNFVTAQFEFDVESLKEQKINEMQPLLEYLDKYSNNKRYFHFLLSNIAKFAQKAKNPTEYLAKNINNLKEKYPNKLQFVAWDENGKLIKELTDKNGYSYILNKLYQTLNDVSQTIKTDSEVSLRDLDSIKKNINILRTFFGRIFIPENLKFPLLNRINSGPFLTELGTELSYVWFNVDKKISFLCFISDKLLNDYIGLEKISNEINSKNSNFTVGFSVTPHFERIKTKIPSEYETNLSLALTIFENAGNNVFENENALILLSMPQSAIRTFCYLPKSSEEWNFEEKRNVWMWSFGIILLALYSFLIFWFLYKGHFFSIRWKLTALFLFANLAPISVFGFIAKGFVENKSIALKNEITSDLEKRMRDFDNHYNILLDDYTLRINDYLKGVSARIGNNIVKEEDKNDIKKLFKDFDCSELYLIASDGRMILKERNQSKSNQKLEFMNSLGEAILNYSNKQYDKMRNNGDVISNLINPEESPIIRLWIKCFNKVIDVLVGGYTRLYFTTVFGDYANFNSNYIMLMSWDPEQFQNNFIKLFYSNYNKSFSDAEFFVKSKFNDTFYGSEFLLNCVNSIVEKNNMIEKISGVTEINKQRFIFVGINGMNLKDWTIWAFYPESKIIKEQRIIIFQIVGIAFISLLLTIVIGHMLSLQFLKPIHNLGEAAVAIDKRNFAHRVPIVDKDEFGHLNMVFNRVIEGLGDFEVARIVQESLFPGNNFDVGDFRIFGRSVVMTTLGGDYYDCFKINDEYQGIIIGDVAGHGIPAGLMMAMAKSGVLTASEEIKLDPAALTLRLHKMFFAIKNDKLKRMMTFQYFVLRVSDGHIVYTNAGHCFPLIVDHEKKTAEFLQYIATPLGIGARCRCKNQEFDLSKGQSLVLYTDGIVEANNEENEQFGYDRYQACLPAQYDPDPEKFYYNLYNNVYRQWSPKPDDDLTLIVINRNN